MIDAQRVQFSSNLNAYKYLEIQNAVVSVSGTVTAGNYRIWETTIELEELPKYFTVMVQTTTGPIGTTLTWQEIPPAFFYNFNTSGPASNLAGKLAVSVNNQTVRLYVLIFNPYGSTITISSTDVSFKFVPWTVAN